MAKHTRSAWPEPPPPLPTGLTRKIFVTLPLGFTLNRGKTINAILGYFSYWELRDWSTQVEKTGCWSTPPSCVGTRRKAVWKSLYEHLQSVNREMADVA